MPMKLGFVKPALEVIGLLVAIAIGAQTIWQNLPHEPALIGEVLVAPARMSPETVGSLRALPKQVFTDLSSNSALRAQLNLKALAPQLQSVIEDIMSRHIEFLVDPPFGPLSEVVVCDVRNRSDKTLFAVQLRPRLFGSKASAVVVTNEHEEKQVVTTGTIDIGDLQPAGEVRVFLWLSLFSEERLKLSHRDGIGSLRFYRPVPPLVALGGGTWISFRWVQPTLTALLVLVLAVWSWTSRRRRVT